MQALLLNYKRNAGRSTCETHLSTESAQACQDARLSRPHEDPGRPQHHQAPPRQGPQPPLRLRRLAARDPLASLPLSSLTGDAAFRRLRKGRSGHAATVGVRWLPGGELGVRVGIVVSKKVGKAVRRNRVRRRLREALRALLREPGWKETAIDLLIVAKPEAVEADYQRLLKDLRGALRKGKLLA